MRVQGSLQVGGWLWHDTCSPRLGDCYKTSAGVHSMTLDYRHKPVPSTTTVVRCSRANGHVAMRLG